MRLNLCLSGFGNIARHFIRYFSARREAVLARYGLDLRLVTVVGSQGGLHDSAGLDTARLLALPPGSSGLRQMSGLWSPALASAAGIAASSADVLVEATPTDIWTGEPGLAHFRAALEKGMDIVTFTKGPLVKSFGEIKVLARARGARIKVGGATAAALPTMDIGSYSLAGDELQAFEGVLNGTSNYVLSRMAADGLTCEEAIAEAVARGVAEPDPRLDVAGWDTASKTIILANCLFDAEINLAGVPVQGIQEITLADIRAAEARGEAIKLIGKAQKTASGVQVAVRARSIPFAHPLAALSGTAKGIRFISATLGEIVVSGGKSDPLGTAAAGFKDIINLVRDKGLLPPV
ncbi:MAG TPA: homoserine dehydrogenase [Selenomonadales bacterium]|nr:homoserine dehydrogenase [Selenomonadales bacterium]